MAATQVRPKTDNAALHEVIGPIMNTLIPRLTDGREKQSKIGTTRVGVVLRSSDLVSGSMLLKKKPASYMQKLH